MKLPARGRNVLVVSIEKVNNLQNHIAKAYRGFTGNIGFTDPKLVDGLP